MNLLHMVSDISFALWPSGLGNYFVCKRFIEIHAVQTLLWSLEFVIQINLEHDTIAKYLMLVI